MCFAARVDADGGVLLLYTRRHGRGSRVELAHARRVPRPAGEGLELALAALLLGRARRADDAAVPLRRTARASTKRRKSGHVGPEPLGRRRGRGEARRDLISARLERLHQALDVASETGQIPAVRLERVAALVVEDPKLR